MATRTGPIDDHLASFCWENDMGTVEQMFRRAQSRLRELGLSEANVSPFARSGVQLGAFNEAAWHSWIDSVEASDTDQVVALQKLVATCRIRLGLALPPTAEVEVGAVPPAVRSKSPDKAGTESDGQDKSPTEQAIFPVTSSDQAVADDLRFQGTASAVVVRQDESLLAAGQSTSHGTALFIKGGHSAESDGPKPPDEQPPRRFSDAGAKARRYSVQREASPAEECLNITNYASALVAFFQGVVGEFSFALFGSWGRGKTRLMQVVSRELERRGSQVIWFNAWKYRTPPEIWAHLYETVLDQLAGQNWHARFGLSLRTALIRHGLWPVAVTVCASFLTIVPVTTYWNLFASVANLVGIIAIWHLIALVSTGSRASSMIANLLRFPTHRQNLGAQARICDNLSALLIARNPGAFFGSEWAITRSVFLFGVLACLTSFTIVFASVSPPGWLADLKDWRLPTLSSDYWRIGAPTAIWWAIIIWGVLAALTGGRTNKRLMLVVDDLDRCEVPGIVEIIESIKLLLQDDEITNRIQVVMLVEENAIRSAIGQKFTASYKGADEQLRLAIDQHIEKLFVSFLRLPSLEPSEAVEVVERHLNAHRQQALSVIACDSSLSDDAHRWVAHEMARSDASSPARAHVDPDEMLRNDVERVLEHLVYSSGEEAAIVGAIRTTTNPRAWQTPRSIRSTLFKYQLARLLLDSLGISFTAAELMAAIVERAGADPKEPPTDVIQRIAANVA